MNRKTHYIYPPLNMETHKICPSCVKLMIKRMSTEIDNILDGMPVKDWWWHCECGFKITGGIVKGMPELEYYKQEWERINNIK